VGIHLPAAETSALTGCDGRAFDEMPWDQTLFP
jgi:hypothetical protein